MSAAHSHPATTTRFHTYDIPICITVLNRAYRFDGRLSDGDSSYKELINVRFESPQPLLTRLSFIDSFGRIGF